MLLQAFKVCYSMVAQTPRPVGAYYGAFGCAQRARFQTLNMPYFGCSHGHVLARSWEAACTDIYANRRIYNQDKRQPPPYYEYKVAEDHVSGPLQELLVPVNVFQQIRISRVLSKIAPQNKIHLR